MNNKPSIIAICGYKRSGKDTIAEYLTKNYNYNHYKITDKLRKVVQLLFNLNDNDYEKNKEINDTRWNTTPRKIMQFIGTEVFQYKIQELIPNISRNFWIKSLLSDELINNINNNNHKIVISDLRFIHEYENLKQLNIPLVVIKVTNNKIKNIDNHISETEHLKIPIDYEIENNGTLQQLYDNINKIFNYQNK
jgi:dephospho-CoA kinase